MYVGLNGLSNEDFLQLTGLLTFPITGLTIDWFVKVFERRQFWAAFDNSLIITGTVGVVSAIIGTMAAMALARARPRAAGLSMAVLTLPVMVPPLMLGVALLTYFTSVGMKLGLQTVIMGHLVFTQPFVILIVYARMARFDYAVVNSARDLGASPIRVFSHGDAPDNAFDHHRRRTHRDGPLSRRLHHHLLYDWWREQSPNTTVGHAAKGNLITLETKLHLV